MIVLLPSRAAGFAAGGAGHDAVGLDLHPAHRHPCPVRRKTCFGLDVARGMPWDS